MDQSHAKPSVTLRRLIDGYQVTQALYVGLELEKRSPAAITSSYSS